jgi:hypothetical protein
MVADDQTGENDAISSETVIDASQMMTRGGVGGKHTKRGNEVEIE